MTLNFCEFVEIIRNKPFLFQEYNRSHFECLLNDADGIKCYLNYIDKDKSKKYRIKNLNDDNYVELSFLHHAILNYIIENQTETVGYTFFKYCKCSLSCFCSAPSISMSDVEKCISDLLETGLILELLNWDDADLVIDVFAQKYYCVNFIRLRLLLENSYDEINTDKKTKTILLDVIKALISAKKIPNEKLEVCFNFLLDNYILKKTICNEFSFSDWFWIMGTFNNMSYDEIKKCHDSI